MTDMVQEKTQETEKVSDGAREEDKATDTLVFNENELKSALEALLFVTDEPVNVLTLADAIQVNQKHVERALIRLQEELQEQNRGIQLREIAGGWRLVTHPVFHELIESYIASWDTKKLSQAALETLSIVAYCQPITRNEISSIRGVSSDSSVNSLLEKGLLREVGVQDTPGNPVLYGTSKLFLEKFGLKKVSDLPSLESFAPDEETKALISERLRVVKVDESSIVQTKEEIQSQTFDLSQIEFDNDYALESENQNEDAMQSLLKDALASSVGVVDKINFDELIFEDE